MPQGSHWSTAGPNGPTGSCCWSGPRVPARATSPRSGPRQPARARYRRMRLTAAAVPGALATGALVVEDLSSSEVDERALFHLMNLAREDGAYVLITARLPPSAFQIELRDLRSRLRAVPVVSLLPPDDQLFRALIVKFCADRQLVIDETRGELSGIPDRALLCGRKADGRASGYRGLAPGPAGDPGAGGRIAARCLMAAAGPHLDVAGDRNIMSLKRHCDKRCFAPPPFRGRPPEDGLKLHGIRASHCNQ